MPEFPAWTPYALIALAGGLLGCACGYRLGFVRGEQRGLAHGDAQGYLRGRGMTVTLAGTRRAAGGESLDLDLNPALDLADAHARALHLPAAEVRSASRYRQHQGRHE